MFSIFDALGPHIPPIKIIDVGALDAGPEHVVYRALLGPGRSSVVGFEPDEAERAKLNAAAPSGHLFLPHAIGDGRKAMFRQCSQPMASSLFEPNTALLDKFQAVGEATRVVSTREIGTRRLDDVPEAAGADFLKLDIQGAELMAIEGASRILEGVAVVHTEIEFVPMYLDQPLFADIDRALRAHGFLFHRFASLASRALKPIALNDDANAPISQVLWGDAVYAKSFMAFDTLPLALLFKLAAIAHEVYRSIDLAHHALERHDARAGTGHAANYLARLMGKALKAS